MSIAGSLRASRASRAAVAAGFLVLVSGCVLYRGPRGVEDALERQLGVELEREYGVKLGWTSTKIVMAFANSDDDMDGLDLDIDGIGVATYIVPPGAKRPRLDPARLGLSGWDTAIRARDEDGDVLLMTRARRGKIREIVFVAYDDEEVVLGRLKGDLGDLVEKMVRDTKKDGTRAARRAIPVSD